MAYLRLNDRLGLSIHQSDFYRRKSMNSRPVAHKIATSLVSCSVQVRLNEFPPATSTSQIADNGKVRLGGQGPVFTKSVARDSGKVRLGGQGPLFR